MPQPLGTHYTKATALRHNSPLSPIASTVRRCNLLLGGFHVAGFVFREARKADYAMQSFGVQIVTLCENEHLCYQMARHL